MTQQETKEKQERDSAVHRYREFDNRVEPVCYKYSRNISENHLQILTTVSKVRSSLKTEMCHSCM